MNYILISAFDHDYDSNKIVPKRYFIESNDRETEAGLKRTVDFILHNEIGYYVPEENLREYLEKCTWEFVPFNPHDDEHYDEYKDVKDYNAYCSDNTRNEKLTDEEIELLTKIAPNFSDWSELGVNFSMAKPGYRELVDYIATGWRPLIKPNYDDYEGETAEVYYKGAIWSDEIKIAAIQYSFGSCCDPLTYADCWRDVISIYKQLESQFTVFDSISAACEHFYLAATEEDYISEYYKDAEIGEYFGDNEKPTCVYKAALCMLQQNRSSTHTKEISGVYEDRIVFGQSI